MAGKKRIKRRTYKKIIAKAMALSMCISIFYPGGTGIVAYAAEETNNSIVHSWDFEDGMQDWGVSGWTLEDMKSSMVVANESGRLKVNLDYKGKNDNGNTNWLQAGIQQNNLSGVSFAGTDTLSFDFWYKSDSKTTGSLSLKVVAESDAGNAVISDTIAVTDNGNLPASELDDNWKKVNLSFKMDESKTGTTVKDFMLLVVGQDTDYSGDVYFDNIKVYKSDTTEGDIPSEILYDFEENQPEGWDVSDWDFKEAIKLSNELQRLKAELDFSDKLSNGWAQAGIEQTELSGVDFAGKNCITFDFYYNDQYKSAGNFTIKAVVEADVNGSSKSIISSDCLDVTSNNELPEEKLEDGWTKKKLTFDLDEIQAATVPATRLVFLVVGRNTKNKK